MALNIPDSAKYQSLPDELFRVGQDDGQAEEIVRPSTTYWHDVWGRFRRDPLALIGLVVIAAMALMAIFVPMVSPYSYDGMDLTSMNQGPSLQHPCGTSRL